MILPNWLESITLVIYDNAPEEASNICMDYWKMDGGVFQLNTDQILKKYDIENIHKLIFIVNTNSRFYHTKECAEKACDNTHSFNSRSEFKAGISTSKITRNFPYYDNNQYRKTTPIVELFEKERWYCNKHTKIINDKRVLKKEAKISEEWKEVLKSLENLQAQFELDSVEIGRFTDYESLAKQVAKAENKSPKEIEGILSNRNYTQCFEHELYLPRREAWLLFCDYWIYGDDNKWVYTEPELCRKYKIKLSELSYMLEKSGSSMPLLVDKYTEEIIKSREEYLSNKPENSNNVSASKFNDSKELAGQLRTIAKQLPSGEAYYLRESADHIEGLYRHYKELVNRGN